MKIIYLSLIIMLSMVPVRIEAQDSHNDSAYKTQYGLKTGLGIAELHGDTKDYNIIDRASKKALFIGGFALMRVNNIIYVQPEIIYTNKGAKAADPDRKDRLNLTYLEFPVLAKLYILPKASIRPHLFFGPAPNILLSAEYDSGGHDYDIKDEVTKFDFGLVAGGGFDIEFGNGLIMIDARYTHGVISADDSGEDLHIKNTVVLFTIGYAF